MTKKRPGETTEAGETKRKPRKRPARKTATAATAGRPKIRASHAHAKKKKPPARRGEGARTPRRRSELPPPEARLPLAKRAALTGPKRLAKRTIPPEATPQQTAARSLAIALAAAGLEKKALGIEILDVTGRVDYADFLVIMTGRSDRHVHAIATGIEHEMRKLKNVPLSMEGLQQASWVLIDFGDVVVHVFQEETRMLYDIEGLWIDVGRVPVPAEQPPTATSQPPPPPR